MKNFYIFLIGLVNLASITCQTDPQLEHKFAMNRLSQEKSPYLLQHADNPVDWYPWGEEAFTKAQELNRPIFLSIGYSTCHWCHVMEHESFEDSEVAELLNNNFICIKVDREELPEVDHVYMSVCQIMTGSGGWPLTIIMTPEKEPFFAGTYIPKSSRSQRTGLMQLLPAVTKAWANQQDQIAKSISQIKDVLQKSISKQRGNTLDESILEITQNQFKKQFDPEYGGFGKSPKFPSPHNLIFLLRYYHYKNDSSALAMATTTLQNMRGGGIYDHIGFGFHRYSTDQNWKVPHFEKMLYDQAMISMAYLEAYQITNDEWYAQVAREIFTYILRDMTSNEGGFYSAEDADSENEEGKFYLWSYKELKKILNGDFTEFVQRYNISESGNYIDESSQQKTGMNIPYLGQAESLPMLNQLTALKKFNQSYRKKLFNVRNGRIHPLKDDKILTDWNGLMIASLAKSSIILDSPNYLKAAKKSADFVLNNLKDKNGRLYKRYRDNEARFTGHLDDYSFLIWGLLEIYSADFDQFYLEAAINLTNILIEDFWDDEYGGFNLGSDHSETLFIRSKTGYDGAIPSGNSIAAQNFLKLGRITGNSRWLDLSEKIWDSFSDDIERSPMGFASMQTAYLFSVDSPKEVVLVGDKRSAEFQSLINEIQKKYLPNVVAILKDPVNPENDISKIAPWTNSHVMLDNKITAYVCEDFSCKQPTNNSIDILNLLHE